MRSRVQDYESEEYRAQMAEEIAWQKVQACFYLGKPFQCSGFRSLKPLSKYDFGVGKLEIVPSAGEYTLIYTVEGSGTDAGC